MQFLFFLLFFLSFAFVDCKEIFPAFPEVATREFAYRSPSSRYSEYFGWEQIASGVRRQGVTLQHHSLFDRITLREEVGFIGYHASAQGFRIYQDIIRLIIEEHLHIPIRDDFHFFRIPGDPLYSAESLLEWGSKGYDANVFLCMNYAIFGNHTHPGSSSYYRFALNGWGNQNFEKRLDWLVERLALDPEKIPGLFRLAYEKIGAASGVIYQLFDASHHDARRPYYFLADRFCRNWGSHLPFSQVVVGTNRSPFAAEIHMLLSNRGALNPNESLVVRRYDKLTHDEAACYINALRDAVRALCPSKERCESYRQELLELWEYCE